MLAGTNHAPTHSTPVWCDLLFSPTQIGGEQDSGRTTTNKDVQRILWDYCEKDWIRGRVRNARRLKSPGTPKTDCGPCRGLNGKRCKTLTYLDADLGETVEEIFGESCGGHWLGVGGGPGRAETDAHICWMIGTDVELIEPSWRDL